MEIQEIKKDKSIHVLSKGPVSTLAHHGCVMLTNPYRDRRLTEKRVIIGADELVDLALTLIRVANGNMSNSRKELKIIWVEKQ